MLVVAISGLVWDNWRNLILSLDYISHIWSLHFRIYETYPCLLAAFCLFGWEVAVWILVEIFMGDLFPCLQWHRHSSSFSQLLDSELRLLVSTSAWVLQEVPTGRIFLVSHCLAILHLSCHSQYRLL